MNPAATLGADNALLGREAASSADFVPQSVADCAWYGAWMVSGTADQAWLEARGITPAWDKDAGRLSLSVSDPARFAPHIGESRRLALNLLPAGGTVSFELRLLPDITVSVADGKSLTEDFYLGQRRTLTVGGFAGSTVCYAADQDPCGRSAAGAAHRANVQWKTTSDAAAGFPTCAVDGAGRVVLDVSDPAYAAQRYTGSLDIYAFYPNRFQTSHSGWTSRDGVIRFFSEDALNDSFELPVRISEPRLQADVSAVMLPIDGNEVETGIGYRTFDGSAPLPAASFDPTLLRERLALELRSYGGTHTPWMSCLALEAGSGRMWVRRTTSDAGALETRTFSQTNGAWSTGLGYVELRSPALGDLYAGSERFSVRVSMLRIGRLRSGIHSFFVENDTVFQSDYLNGSGLSLLEEDGRFSMSASFSFPGADLSRIDWQRTGAAMSYQCRRAPFETVQPVIDFVVDVPDAGSGGTFSWVYDEAHQVMRSSSGEPVPGGLILPYDTQTMTGTVTNKWDGRQFTESVSFDLTYPVILANLLVVARSGGANASVYLMPYKITKYLLRMGSGVDTQARRWMMQLFGRSDWMDHVYAYNCYQRRPGLNDYHRPGPSRGMPLTDYSIRYLWEYLYNQTNVQAWTQAAADLVPTLYPSSICNQAYLDFNSFQTRFFHQLQGDSSPLARAIWWTKAESF